MRKKKLSPSQTDGVQYRKVKGWQLALGMMHSASVACFFMAIGYVSYVANLGFGIPTMTVGILMTAARIFDGITDPVISILIDKINTRFGKIRLFMTIGWLIEALSMKLLFDWVCGKGHSIILFTVIYLIYYIGYTLHNMAGSLINPVITNDPKQRPLVGVLNTIYNYVVSIVLSIGITMVLLPKYGYTYTTELFATISTLVVGLSAVFLIFALIGLSPIDKPENFIVSSKAKQKPIKAKDMWNLLKSNKALQCYIFAATSDKLAMQITGQSIISTILYGIIIGNMQLSAIINIIAIVPILIFAVVGGKYTGKHGSKESLVFWTRISVGLNILFMVYMLATARFAIAQSTPLLILFVIMTMVANGLRIAVSTATSSMMADVVDYEAARTEKYLPGAVAGVYSFIDKLVSSLGATIATACVALIGYTSTMPQPTDPKTMPVIAMGCFIIYGIPVIGWVCTLISMKFSPISKDGMIEVQKTIAENKAD